MGLLEGWWARIVLLWARRVLYGLRRGLVYQDRAGMARRWLYVLRRGLVGQGSAAKGQERVVWA